MNSTTHYEAIVIGGGPAGLSAGLWLARYRRRVLILDSGKPRNDETWAVHGYPGIVDPPPHELRRVLIEQAKEAGAEWRSGEVNRVTGEKNNFKIHCAGCPTITARRVILAYGRRDNLPEVDGGRELYGTSVFHCPDCDGPSLTGQAACVYGWNRTTAIHGLYLLTWAKSVVMLTDGREPELAPQAYAALEKYKVPIKKERIRRLVSENGCLKAAELEDGTTIPMSYLFFNLGSPLATDIGMQLGCEPDKEKNLVVDRSQETTVKGVFAVGDIAGPPYLAVTAAAQGVTAAITVHRSLLPPDMEI